MKMTLQNIFVVDVAQYNLFHGSLQHSILLEQNNDRGECSIGRMQQTKATISLLYSKQVLSE